MQNKPSHSVGEETTCLNLSKNCTVAPLSNSISALKSPSKKMVELGRKANLSSSHSSHSPQQTHSDYRIHAKHLVYKVFLGCFVPKYVICLPKKTIHHLLTWICHLLCFLSVFPPFSHGEHSKLESRIAKAAMILKGTMNHSLQSLAIETSQQPRFAKADAWDHDVSGILVDKAYPKIEWILDQSLNLGF